MRETFVAKKTTMLSCVLLDEYPYLGKNRVARLISAKNVKINEKRVSVDLRVEKNASVEVFIPASFIPNTPTVVYSDDNILIVDKPVHMDSTEALPKILEKEYGKLFPVHRLDTNTTGIIALARGIKTKTELERAFKERGVQKKYIATVVGKPKKPSGTIRNWLVKDAEKGIVKASVTKINGSLEAITDYEVISAEDGLSKIALYPHTGRTHQLRAQLASIGCPILGDGKYGDYEENKKRGVSVQQLRAVSIKFIEVDGIINYLCGKEFEVVE